MADYALHRMRLRQENKLANVSSKIPRDIALAEYGQQMVLNRRIISDYDIIRGTDKLAPALKAYYWDRMKELCDEKKTKRPKSKRSSSKRRYN